MNTMNTSSLKVKFVKFHDPIQVTTKVLTSLNEEGSGIKIDDGIELHKLSAIIFKSNGVLKVIPLANCADITCEIPEEEKSYKK